MSERLKFHMKKTYQVVMVNVWIGKPSNNPLYGLPTEIWKYYVSSLAFSYSKFKVTTGGVCCSCYCMIVGAAVAVIWFYHI